jgi:hypothetical protein
LDGGDKAKKSLDKAKETGKDGDKKLYINPANNISPEDPLFMSVSDDRGLLCSSPSWSRNEELPTSAVTRTISVLGDRAPYKNRHLIESIQSQMKEATRMIPHMIFANSHDFLADF